MKRLLFLPLLLCALALGGCANPLDPNGKSFLAGGTSITAPISSPVGRQELAIVQNAYGLALTAAVNYRRYCYGAGQTATGACANRRGIVLQMQALDRQAYAAIKAARNFIRNNPTISAVSAVAAARAAVADFQSVTASNGVPQS